MAGTAGGSENAIGTWLSDLRLLGDDVRRQAVIRTAYGWACAFSRNLTISLARAPASCSSAHASAHRL